MELTYERIYERLSRMPVAVNNFYGDPTLLWENTIEKVERLAEDSHRGPVGILTRGLIDPGMARELRDAAEGLSLIGVVSISGLPLKIEPVSTEARYKTIANLREAGIPVLVCVRPIVMSMNGDWETLESLIRGSSEAGAKHFVVSGIRGNDEILLRSGLTREELNIYTLRIKVLPPGMGEFIDEMASRYAVDISTRVACGVSKALDLERCYNHYQASPLLSRCDKCVFKERCRSEVRIDEVSLEIVSRFGYDVVPIIREAHYCSVDPKTRKSCPSCCTCCFMQDNTRIEVRNENTTLGDLGFIRFVTGVPAVKHGVVDGSPDAGHVHLWKYPEVKHVRTVNSWYALSRSTQKCYGCSYCIVKAYDVGEEDYGVYPSDLARMIAD